MANGTRLPAILLQTYTPTIRLAPQKCKEKVVEARTVAVLQKTTEHTMVSPVLEGLEHNCLLLLLIIITVRFLMESGHVYYEPGGLLWGPGGLLWGPGGLLWSLRSF